MGLSNAQYDELMREYNFKRIERVALLDERRMEIFKKIPEYKEADERIGDLAIKRFELLSEKNSDKASMIKQEMADLSKKKKELLIQNGYDIDYLKPGFSCEMCKDTGYVGSEKCSCFKKKIIKLLYAQSNIASVLERENFSTFSYDYYSDEEMLNMKGVVEELKSYCDNFSNENKSYLFTGNAGSGKTFLSNCIAKELMDKGFSVIYFTAVQLFDTLASYAFGYDDREEGLSMREDLVSCDLLVIDDLGTELTNSFSVSQFFNLINERIIRNKATIISTNIGLTDISARYEERSFSRIIGHYETLSIRNSDLRIKIKRLNNQAV